jgi:hypothetical protein
MRGTSMPWHTHHARMTAWFPRWFIGSAFEAGAVSVGLLRSLASASRSLRSSFAITA